MRASMLRLPLSLRSLLSLFCFLFLSRAAASAQAPTPVSVLGHNPGDDFYLADYEDTVRYFHALTDASDGRMKMFTVGKTTQGKAIEIAVISSPKDDRSAP